MAGRVRVEVIPALCRGHGKCSRIAPEVFTLDENGFAWVQLEEVPAELADRARKAVYACPSKALLITTG
ncbi:MAG: ferredoxin [Actinomycetota bacterium]